MAIARGYTAGRFALELDGVQAGYVNSVTGGEPFADVISGPAAGAVIDKSVGPVQYEPIVIETGTVDPAFFGWITDALNGKASAKNGAILMLDYNYKVQQRLDWKNGVIDVVAFPAADGGDKNAARLRVTIRPQSAQLLAGSGVTLAVVGGKAQKQSTANAFRWAVSGLESSCTKTREVSSVTVRRGAGDVLEVDNIEFVVAAVEAGPFRAWFDDMVHAGGPERTATLSFLDPTLKNELLHIDLRGLGVCRVSEARKAANAEAVIGSTVEMYCEAVGLLPIKAPEPPPAPPPGTSSADSGMERLVAALVDAIGARNATSTRSAETIASRLLTESVEAPPADDRERGIAAGRAWAADVAHLGELDDLAALADRDDWAALALGDDHSLVSFLADHGVLDPGDPAPTDLTRDDFTMGLVAGAAEIHQEVAPLLVERHRRG